MPASKKRKMVSLQVTETSGVDHPAHLDEGWIVMKSASNESEVAVSDSDMEPMDPSLEDAYIERVMELEKALLQKDEEIAVLKAMTVEVEEEEEEEDDEMEDESEMDLMKSAPAPVREALQKARAEADSAREELRKEREARRDEQFVAKAAGWDNLTIDPQEVGVALRKMADFMPDVAETVEKALESANAQADAAAIFNEIGRAGSRDDSNAYAKVETMAKSAVKSGEYKTFEQAVAAIVQQNPELYAAYRNER